VGAIVVKADSPRAQNVSYFTVSHNRIWYMDHCQELNHDPSLKVDLDPGLEQSLDPCL
jgi:hypothetical protein